MVCSWSYWPEGPTPHRVDPSMGMPGCPCNMVAGFLRVTDHGVGGGGKRGGMRALALNVILRTCHHSRVVSTPLN